MTSLNSGTLVWIRNKENGKRDSKGVIDNQIKNPTYRIKLESGKIVHRNHRMIRQCLATGCQQNYSDQEYSAKTARRSERIKQRK